jgi:hypothetical protein
MGMLTGGMLELLINPRWPPAKIKIQIVDGEALKADPGVSSFMKAKMPSHTRVAVASCCVAVTFQTCRETPYHHIVSNIVKPTCFLSF